MNAVDIVVVDDTDPMVALERTIDGVASLLVQAILEVANRHVYEISSNTELKEEFWSRAEAVTGRTRRNMLGS